MTTVEEPESTGGGSESVEEVYVPPPPPKRPWPAPLPALGATLEEYRVKRLANYRNLPLEVTEHANIELRMREHGYQGRQVYELVQNAADAALEQGVSGYIELCLTEAGLYAANTGAPLDQDGLDALLYSHMSRKRGQQIGRFGLGFKSVTGLSSRPQIHSRSVSIQFDGVRAGDEIRKEAQLSASTHVPTLRLGWSLDTSQCVGDDAELAKLAAWADTVVWIPFTEENAYENVARKMSLFLQTVLEART